MGGEATYICRGRYSRQSARSKKRSSGVWALIPSKQRNLAGSLVNFSLVLANLERCLQFICSKERSHSILVAHDTKRKFLVLQPSQHLNDKPLPNSLKLLPGDNPPHGPHSNSQETRKTVNDRLMARPVINPAPVLQIPHLLGNLLCSRCRENLRPGQSVGLEFISR